MRWSCGTRSKLPFVTYITLVITVYSCIATHTTKALEQRFSMFIEYSYRPTEFYCMLWRTQLLPKTIVSSSEIWFQQVLWTSLPCYEVDNRLNRNECFRSRTSFHWLASHVIANYVTVLQHCLATVMTSFGCHGISKLNHTYLWLLS